MRQTPAPVGSSTPLMRLAPGTSRGATSHASRRGGSSLPTVLESLIVRPAQSAWGLFGRPGMCSSYTVDRGPSGRQQPDRRSARASVSSTARTSSVDLGPMARHRAGQVAILRPPSGARRMVPLFVSIIQLPSDCSAAPQGAPGRTRQGCADQRPLASRATS